MIAIIGATSTIGNALLHRFIELDVPARALSREPEKLRAQLASKKHAVVELAAADAADPDSLRAALRGASQLFLSMANSPRQVEWETAIIRMAKEEGVSHIVKISSPVYREAAPVEIAKWHQQIELALAASGLTHTVLRPYAFMQNLLRLSKTISSGRFFQATMGETPCNFIDCRDIADVAAAVLTRPELAGQAYTLTGSEVFSYPQIADKLSGLLGQKINCINVEAKVLRNDLIQFAGMPEWMADHVVEIQAMAMALPEQPTNTVKRLLGREPRTLDDFLQENIGAFR